MELKFELRVVFLLLYISSLHAIAILVFTRGFLLTRNELPLFSHCDDLHEDAGCNLAWPNVPASENSSDSFRAVSAEEENGRSNCRTNGEPLTRTPRIAAAPPCWTPPSVKKVVILVFDALRFDFVAPSGLSEDKWRPWMDRLQVVQKLIVEESSRARLFKFLADPPTTSLQRLKGLTTGSLPTFIDVGNSFGAPAIVEDNIINQLASNGRKVIMMGDDTWLDLFPSQFFQAFPFPSFNVKDLHTVDDGVLENLFPALYEDNWDVLIGHFLGVDHVGHIFGVESTQMVEKLEQYNKVVEDVISILRNQSHGNGLHDDTLLLVLGDHGQTLNGDHGGGTSEEVETALFAWISRQPTHPVSQFCDSSCINDLIRDKSLVNKRYCICDFQQLDFAATFSAILGIPIPYGSIGKVNPQLFGFVARMWQPSQHEVSVWSADDWRRSQLQIYTSVLCVNSWQVNRFFQQYSKSSLNGFSSIDLALLQSLYEDAKSFSREWSARAPKVDLVMTQLSDGLGRYTRYLHAAAALARSKWTKFSDGLMAFGVIILLVSLLVQLKAIYVLIVLGSSSLLGKVEDCISLLPLQEMGMSGFIFGVMSASALTVISVLVYLFSGQYVSLSKTHFVIIVIGSTVIGTAKSYLFRRNEQSICNMNDGEPRRRWQQWVAGHEVGFLAISFSCIHAISLLSNSFILTEQHVVTFFLVSIGLLDLRMALQQNSRVPQALCFMILNFILSSLSDVNLLKENGYQTGETTPGMDISSSPSFIWQLLVALFTVYVPLIVIGGVFMKFLWRSSFIGKYSKGVLYGLALTYAAICLHWLLDDLHKLHLMSIPEPVEEFARLQIPQILYFIMAFQTLLVLCNIEHTRKRSEMQLKNLFEDGSLALLGILSGIILLLLGKQGPLVAVISGLEAWCLLEKQSLYAPLQRFQYDNRVDINYSSATIQWSLFAVQVFFCTGHRCSFDGLHYAAAFIGYDHFNIYRQGALLALDTFGASHILPIISVALLVSKRCPPIRPIFLNEFYKLQLSQAMLMFELLRTITATFMTVCVTIQRRHLMVWGLFAPKYVFDAIGLLVTDVLVIFGFVYIMWPSLF